MNELREAIEKIKTDALIDKKAIVAKIQEEAERKGYTLVERNDQKPWGAYLRLQGDDADRFLKEFFPEVTPDEARLGMKDAELSPKFLVVAPGGRLSWQFHKRRAERWRFLTDGGYHKSSTDDEGDVIWAKPGDVVQFLREERHRLVGGSDAYTIVAEIWQHVETHMLSDEDDIVRLADDYNR